MYKDNELTIRPIEEKIYLISGNLFIKKKFLNEKNGMLRTIPILQKRMRSL